MVVIPIKQYGISNASSAVVSFLLLPGCNSRKIRQPEKSLLFKGSGVDEAQGSWDGKRIREPAKRREEGTSRKVGIFSVP